MLQITAERLSRLLAAHEPLCISLYLPTHRRLPENKQDPILYRNLLAEMESSLSEKYPVRQVREIMEKFQSLAADDLFWRHRTDGLAIFSAHETFEVYELQRPVQKLLVIADSFHTKPLVRILQSADRYQVLCLSQHEARLYEGNRDGLDSVELIEVPTELSDVLTDERSPSTQSVGSYGKRSGEGGSAVHHGHQPRTDLAEAEVLKFFRAVDRGILEHHSRLSGLPLLLVALARNQADFRSLSHNPFLLAEGISIDPDSLDLEKLRQLAWKGIEPFYLNRLIELTEKFATAQSRQSGSGDLSDVARAAVSNQVATLLVEADRVIPGVIDRETGAIGSVNPTNSHVDDMLDDLAELVMAKGGEVVIVPAARMPTTSGLAAIYRY